MMVMVLLLLFAFVLGSIPTGVVVARAKGVDLRKVGSGNIGATNVLRSVGKWAALITLIGDMAKGMVPVLLGGYMGLPEVYTGLLGLIAVLGHDFSLFLRFKGGKGVATSLGALVVYSPLAGLACLATWVVVALTTKYSSLSALVAFILSPLYVYLLDPSGVKVFLVLPVTGLILFKHRDNIKRLIQGTEPKIGQSRKKEAG